MRPMEGAIRSKHAMLLFGLASLLCGLVACGSTDGPATAAVRDSSGIVPEALTSGVLGGDPDTGCLWLEESSGNKQQVLLAGEFEVDWSADPAQVLKDGAGWARVGEDIRVGGGNQPGIGVSDCPVPPPASGTLWHIYGLAPQPEGAP